VICPSGSTSRSGAVARAEPGIHNNGPFRETMPAGVPITIAYGYGYGARVFTCAPE